MSSRRQGPLRPSTDESTPEPDARFTFRLKQPTTSLDEPPRVADGLSGLASLTSLHSEVGDILKDAQEVTCFYVHLPNAAIVEDRYGWQALETLVGSVASYLRQEASRLRRERGTASLNHAFADDFVLLCPSSVHDERFRTQLAEGLSRHLRALDEDLATIGQVFVGKATAQPLPRFHMERLAFRVIQAAQQDALDVGHHILEQQARLLEHSLGAGDFHLHFQPIVRATDLTIFGHEALVRSHCREFANPYVLFDVAEKTGRLRLLTRHLRQATARAAADLPAGQFMFLNLHPNDLEDPELYEPPEWLTKLARRMVLEITERSGIEDYQRFRKRLQPLRDLGFLVAIDDLGSGYSALNNVAEIEPDIIKLDILLIRGIDESKVRRDLVRKLVSFAQDIECLVVAEGIETAEQLQVVRDLGCHLLQGFYLSRPAPGFLERLPEDVVRRTVKLPRSQPPSG